MTRCLKTRAYCGGPEREEIRRTLNGRGGKVSAIDENRNLRMRQHLLRFAAEQQGADTATPVRGHVDQITATFRCRFDDRFVGNVAGQGFTRAGNAGLLAEIVNEAEILLILNM